MSEDVNVSFKLVVPLNEYNSHELYSDELLTTHIRRGDLSKRDIIADMRVNPVIDEFADSITDVSLVTLDPIEFEYEFDTTMSRLHESSSLSDSMKQSFDNAENLNDTEQAKIVDSVNYVTSALSSLMSHRFVRVATVKVAKKAIAKLAPAAISGPAGVALSAGLIAYDIYDAGSSSLSSKDK